MNRGEEDYIKAIYELSGYQGTTAVVSNADLAQLFSHTAQTVNEMIKRLSRKGLVVYTPYKGSVLTDNGIDIAERMIRVHRIWETFLVDKLGYNWEDVHEEAERLEHATSGKLEEEMFRYLGEPRTCPHGNIIPNDNQGLIDRNIIGLMDAVVQMSYRLVSVVDDKELLIYLNQRHMTIGQEFVVESIDSIGEIIIIKIENRQVAIGYKVARKLYISQL